MNDRTNSSKTNHLVVEEIQLDKNESTIYDGSSNSEFAMKRTKGRALYGGFMFSLLTSLTSVFSSLASKTLVGRNYNPMNISIWRYQGNLLVVPCIILYLRIIQNKNAFDGVWSDKGRTLFILITRGIVGYISYVFFVYSLKYLSIADSKVITFSTPIAVLLFANLCLGELCGIVPVCIALLTLSGMVVLSRPPLLTGAQSFDTQNLIGVGIASAGMLTLALIFVIIRHLRKLHFTMLLLSSGCVSTVSGLIFTLCFGVFELPRTREDWLIVGGAAMCGVTNHLFMTLSLKYEEAGPISLFRTVDIVFAFIAQYIFLDASPDVYSIVGATIIVIGICVTTFRKWLSTLSEENTIRLRFWFILK